MRLYLLASFFFSPFLLASFSEPVRLEYATGYRNDRLHWHLQDPGDGGALRYSEVYRDLQFWENALSLTVYHRDIYFFLSGGFAAFGRGGSVRERYADLSFASEDLRFHFTPSGWAADGEVRLGYAVNLTDGRIYKTVLVPFVGFSGHLETLERKNPNPLEREGPFYTMRSQLPGDLHLSWYGFLLGGLFHIDPGGPILFDVGYHYSWLHVRFHTHYANEVALISPPSAVNTYDAIKAKTGGNLGHTGWTTLSYRLSCQWQIGLGALVRYFVSRDFSTSEYQHTSFEKPVKIAEKLKIRWTVVSGWASISKSF